jgi:hypothetical protein
MKLFYMPLVKNYRLDLENGNYLEVQFREASMESIARQARRFGITIDGDEALIDNEKLDKFRNLYDSLQEVNNQGGNLGEKVVLSDLTEMVAVKDKDDESEKEIFDEFDQSVLIINASFLDAPKKAMIGLIELEATHDLNDDYKTTIKI